MQHIHSPLFFFNDTATTEIYTLSLHDALPISPVHGLQALQHEAPAGHELGMTDDAIRSEEHTSELQSHLNLVCRLLLEKKKRPPSNHRRGGDGRWWLPPDRQCQHLPHLQAAPD